MHFGLLSPARDIGREYWLGPTYDRVEIEIGPGSCGYLIEAARLAPRCVHVGIEIQPSALARARETAAMPANLRLLEADGGWVVRHLLAAASVDAFHVYFPDPWWKKRHHKRRIFQDDFCTSLARALVPGGGVFVVTDVVPLFTEIRQRMEAAGFSAEPWRRSVGDIACSSYERKYRRQGRHFEQAVFRVPTAG